MKFLVLALCVCAASAASFPRYGNYAKATATVNYQPTPVPVAPLAAVDSVPEVPEVLVAKKDAYVAKNYYNNVTPVKTDTYVAKNYVDGKDVDAQVVRSNSEVNVDSFAFNYETSNGIAAEAQGAVKEIEKGVEALVVRGQYQYQSPTGPVVVTYIADENGYQPQGDVIPTPHPVPLAIARSLEYIAAHTRPVETVLPKRTTQ